MKDNSKLTAIILVIITIVVLSINFFLNKKDVEKKKEQIDIVTNYSDFYTINSCLYRTVNYISQDDKSSLSLILNSSYKKNNNITENNVLDLFDDIEQDSTFESKKMYYERVNNNLEKYYVYGVVLKNQIYDEFQMAKSETKDMYFIVYLDRKNKTFAIEPYSKDMFINLEAV